MTTRGVGQQTAPSTPKRPSKTASSQSLNHLLNFSLPPRQTHQLQSLPRRSRRHGTNQAVWNKERFVNAQYRFVMNPNGDYTVHFADPDIYFQWHDILQIIIPRKSAFASAAGGEHSLSQQAEGHTTCPICLSPPTAPRMTKCGHVFCFPCILHYFSTSANPKWIRCPICFDTVNEKQLKSVHWFDGPSQYEDEADEPHPEASSSSSSPDNGRGLNGSTLRMRLMQRPQITTLALPRSPTWPSDLLPPHQAPFHFLPDVYTYSKFMLASPTYLVENLTRDLDDLAVERRMLASLGDNLSLMFIEAAESKVQVQVAKATALDTDVLRNSIDRAVQVQHDIEARVSHHNMRRKLEQEAAAVVTNPDASEVPQAYLATRASPFNTVPAVDISAPTQFPQSPQSQPQSQSQRNPRQRRNLNPPPPSTSTYYYYQAASGMPIFLHPLDIKILNAHFNGYASFPDSITVRVESFAEGSVNDDLRKRCKYLSHMPEGADVVFVEADLSGVVGADGLRNFEGALKTRRARRKEKGKKDDRAKAKAEEREKERLNHDFGAGRTWRTGAEAEVQAFGFEVPREMMVEDVEVEAEEETVAPPPQNVSGAWGSRSFASAAHSGSGGGETRPAGAGGQRAPRTLRDEQDEWDLDFAWHEMEQRASGGAGAGGAVGGRKKKSNKLVVLGSGPGRRR